MNILQAIESMEGEMAPIRERFPKFADDFEFVSEDNDEQLLTDFSIKVNELLGLNEIEIGQVARFSEVTPDECIAFLKGLAAVTALWTAVIKYCALKKCTLKVKHGTDFIDVTAATSQEAERLFKCASRIIIQKPREGKSTEPPPKKAR
jgi:hypothetical protein